MSLGDHTLLCVGGSTRHRKWGDEDDEADQAFRESLEISTVVHARHFHWLRVLLSRWQSFGTINTGQAGFTRVATGSLSVK